MSTQEFFKKTLTKPDGRELSLYSLRPIADGLIATNPPHLDRAQQAHLRWHPLREEWVAFASHRQNRTFLPPKEYNPLAPTTSTDAPTETPAGDYDMAVFENLFSSFSPAFSQAPSMTVPTRPADGVCEVVVFTQNPDTSLGRLPLAQVELLLKVWSDRYEQIRKHPQIKYVMPFENRGVEVGVTLHHPHGQIYAYPFMPPLPERMHHAQLRHYQNHRKTLLSTMIDEELKSPDRVVTATEHTIAFVPPCARYPYEVWIAPRRAVGSLAEMTPIELSDFARTLKSTLLKYDGLWDRAFPYLMVLYAAPVNSDSHPEWHFHIQFSPPYRTKDRLKFLAGTELGAAMFVNDSLPEEKAAELRAVHVPAFEGAT